MDILTSICTSLVSVAVGAVFGAALSRSKALLKSGKADQVILKGVARSQLEDWHRMYVMDGEPLSMKRHEEICELYGAYKAKGGNGTGDRLYEELMLVDIDVIA